MTPRTLVLRVAALHDIARHEARLRERHGPEVVRAWTEAPARLARAPRRPRRAVWHRAALGAQFGTAHRRHPDYRTFGYHRQATILAEFTDATLDVVRIRFAGEDWQE